MELVLVIISVTALRDGLVTYVVKVIFITLLYYFTIFQYIIIILYSIIHVTAVCIPQCVHGSCIQPDVCACDPGWTGLRCTVG